jgi:exopolysaccharide biosynthesis polyprenyl glycosylphosphotransferase
VLVFRSYGLYERDAKRVSHTTIDDLPSLVHSVLVGTLLMGVLYAAAPTASLRPSDLALFGVVALVVLLLLRSEVRRGGSRLLGPERVLFVGNDATTATLVRKIVAHPEYGLEPVGVLGHGSTAPSSLRLPVLGQIEDADIAEIAGLHRIERVIVSHTDVEEDTLLHLLRRCKQLTLKVSVLPQLFDAMGPSVEIDDVEGVTVLGINPPVLSRSSRALKRAMDIAGSATVLVLASPLLVVIGLAVRLDSRGPMLFSQQRIGKDGRRFRVYKFRTMVIGAELRTTELLSDSEDPNWLKLSNDPRVTRVGGWLRRSSLDELPQLFNVLRGEMSLVGPRPLIEREDQQIGGWGRSRLDLTPGITGLWQVLGRTNIPFEEMVKLDYVYVTNWSLWTDVRLILRTLPAVLARRGAN